MFGFSKHRKNICWKDKDFAMMQSSKEQKCTFSFQQTNNAMILTKQTFLSSLFNIIVYLTKKSLKSIRK